MVLCCAQFLFICIETTILTDSWFNAKEFVGNPSVEEFKTARATKDQLRYVAANHNIHFTHETRTDRLGVEQRIEPQFDFTPSKGPSDSALLLEVEK